MFHILSGSLNSQLYFFMKKNKSGRKIHPCEMSTSLDHEHPRAKNS